MLLPLSTLLARSLRRKRAAVSCWVGTVEVMQAVLRACEAQGQAVILTLGTDFEQERGLSPEVLIPLAVQLAKMAEVEATVQVVVPPEERHAKQALAFGAPALYFSYADGAFQPRRTTFAGWAVHEAATYGSEVAVGIGHFVAPPRLEAFVQQSGIQALAVPLALEQRGRRTLSLTFLKEASRAARVPLLASDWDLPPEWLGPAEKAGVKAFGLRTLLQEAYTAGLRTGLRSHAAVDPVRYQSEAMRAVESSLTHYLQQRQP